MRTSRPSTDAPPITISTSVSGSRSCDRSELSTTTTHAAITPEEIAQRQSRPWARTLRPSRGKRTSPA